MYSVNENSGTVTICARVRSPFPVRPDCQLHFSFSVPLDASPATAHGVSYLTFCMFLLSIIHLLQWFTPDTLDYSQSAIGLTFPACESVVCAEIDIVDDNVMEQLKEGFIVSLQSVSTDGRVRVVDQPSIVIIIDDDG